MKVTRIVTTVVENVERCQDCPYYRHFKEGPECEHKDFPAKWPYNIIFPEGRDGIHPKCPLVEK